VNVAKAKKVLLIYDYVTQFEKKKDGLALLKKRETALTTLTLQREEEYNT
jgi:hypothetical protein